MLQVKLVVVGGEAEETEHRLQLPATLGRSRIVDVTLPHLLVSRRHCKLFEADGRLVVRDLGSLNGTFVGSESVQECVLRPGDLLTVGTVTFRAVFGDEESSVVDIQHDEASVLVDEQGSDTMRAADTTCRPASKTHLPDDEPSGVPAPHSKLSPRKHALPEDQLADL